MQLAIQLLISALSLLTLVQANPNLPQSTKTQVNLIANQAIAYAQQVINPTQTSTQQIVVSPIQTSSIVPSQSPTPQVFGTITTQNTMSQLTCTLTADSNKGAPSSNIRVTWTSNADTAYLANDRVMYPTPGYVIELIPASGGSKDVQLSSETGELNKLTATFTGQGATTTCETDVLTQ